ncbi:MAG: class I SAM-dependent methyltransferase family protein [Thermoproteota archaeon]|jgi:Predicted methyltransferase
MNIKNILKGIIPANLHQFIPASYDLIGSKNGQVAIISVPDEIEDYKYKIAEAIIQVHKNVKAVLRKMGPRKGEFRLYDFEILLGRETEVIHREYGYYIKLDPTKVYFSPRDSNDRIDIAKKIKPFERILYLFAGVGPYALAIAKNQPYVDIIIAVEKNPNAFSYMLFNKKINKIENKILCVNDDVVNVCPFFEDYADRVLMTLPLEATQFLELAVQCIKNNGGLLHYYKVLTSQDIEKIPAIVKTDMAGLTNKEIECKLISYKKAGDYSPGQYKYRIDVYIKKRTT